MNASEVKTIENIIQYEFNNKALVNQAFLFNPTDEENPLTNDLLSAIGKRTIGSSLSSVIVEYYGHMAKGKPFRTSNGYAQTKYYLDCLDSKDLYRISVNVLGLTRFVESVQEGQIDDIDRKLFEAIAGALCLDLDFDVKKVGKVLAFMLDLDYWLDNDFDNLDKNPSTKIYNYTIAAGIGLPEYQFKNVKDEFGNRFVNCELLLQVREEPFVGQGDTAQEARLKAAASCYKYLEENKLIVDISKDAGDFTIETAMDTLDNLALKGYFTLADYETKEAKDGFNATVRIDEVDSQFSSFDADKKLARSKAAYKMVCYVLGLKVPEDSELDENLKQ